MKKHHEQDTLDKVKALENKEMNVSEFNIKPYEALNIGRREFSAVKFFDDNWVLNEVTTKEAFEMGIENVSSPSRSDCRADIGNNDRNLFFVAVRKAEKGITYDEFIALCNETVFYQTQEYAWIDRFVGKIERPRFERATGNFNEKTFDFVRVSILLNDIDGCNIKEAANKHFAVIKKMAVEKIATSNQFANYGVPINVLKLTKATLTKQSTLELLFEVKEVA